MKPAAPGESSLAAAVFAGGRSTRMGRDKAFLVHAGSRLLDRQLATLREVRPAQLAISGRADTDYAVPGVDIVCDPTPDLGPLAGLAALLAATALPHLLVLAVDMPQMTAEFLAALGQRRTSGVGVVPRLPSGWEPLAAVYPKEILPRVQAHLAKGDRSFRRLVDEAHAAGQLVPFDVGPAQRSLFANWNRPEEVGGV
jgi:molybdopterin-guanine dinucleotide biosynthesis protein A